MEHEAEFRKLAAAGSDYDERLRMGDVVRAPEYVEEWRKAIRASLGQAGNWPTDDCARAVPSRRGIAE